MTLPAGNQPPRRRTRARVASVGRAPLPASELRRPAAEGARVPDVVRRIVRVKGTVQGVGFRPFVHRTATTLGLCGAVWNEPGGVVVDVEGEPGAVAQLCQLVELAPPPQARIEMLEVQAAAPAGQFGFIIRESTGAEAEQARVVSDLATCDACVRELNAPGDRRYRYLFLNCTDCGPRYTIVRDVPYDRPNTTMSSFTMCEPCAAEYDDPGSRRFHAQPNACSTCGPWLWMESGTGRACGGDPVDEAVRALRAGRIVAMKGLGGFHLCCDARSEDALARLRERKRRPAKPFAVMFADLPSLEREAVLSPAARALLASPRAPIVLVPLRPDSSLAAGVAPGLRELGAFLPYTPLHHRLLAQFDGPLVMTSGNLSEEPIAAGNQEARERLGTVADDLLAHDREIHARVEDSVMRVMGGAGRLLRRARGWVPEALELPVGAPPLLAVGGDLKNAFCLASGRSAVLAPHLGNLACYETRQLFEETRARLERLFRIQPRLVVHDLHPAYHGTALAFETELPRLAVQHHHAHVASCLAEHGRQGPVIGVAWDGSGYGPDGTVWGGEFLVADLAGYRRRGRLRPVSLPGGDAAVRAPWRMALAHLIASDLPTFRVEVAQRAPVEAMIRRGWNAPSTSSAGRLFDAVAAVLGVCAEASYEGQAAAELEAVSDPGEEPYVLPVTDGGELFELDPRPLMQALVRDLDAGVPVGRIGGRVHAGLAAGIVRTARQIRDETSLETVVLTGGCFQNRLLVEETARRLERAGFEVLLHRDVPPNDGGLAFGQAAVAAATARRTRRVSRHSR